MHLVNKMMNLSYNQNNISIKILNKKNLAKNIKEKMKELRIIME